MKKIEKLKSGKFQMPQLDGGPQNRGHWGVTTRGVKQYNDWFNEASQRPNTGVYPYSLSYPASDVDIHK